MDRAHVQDCWLRDRLLRVITIENQVSRSDRQTKSIYYRAGITLVYLVIIIP